jgi:holliday junction DNA helicase RuvA
MLAYLRGKILQKGPNFLIIETLGANGAGSGLGYKVVVTPELMEWRLGEDIELYTYLKVADDGQTLFGLPDFASLQFLELLITVSGVGPKLALTVLSAAKIDILEQAIINQDTEIFTRMSGVGRKTAERIILELKNKITGGGLISAASGSSSDIYDALIGLGYSNREVREAISKIDRTQPTEIQLKYALKLLSN